MLALVALVIGCAHAPPPPPMLRVPPRETAWRLLIRVYGNAVDDVDLALGRSIAANPPVGRTDVATDADGHVDLSVQTTGTPLATERCTVEVRLVVRSAVGQQVLDTSERFDERCGWDGGAMIRALDRAVAWSLETTTESLARAPRE